MRTISIRSARKAKGFSQKELAGLLGVNQSAICQWETGKTGPTFKTIPLIAEILECDIAELFEEDGEWQ